MEPLPPSSGADSERVSARATSGRAHGRRISPWIGMNSRAEVEHCTACLCTLRAPVEHFRVGDRQAQWMIIGEAPGADEDRVGEPFVGRAGKLLDLMLFAMKLKREQVFIANILKSRPPNNRDPAPEEIRACWPFLARQIALARPKIILAMGRVAAQSLLETQVPVGKLRGRVHRLGASATPLIVTYHPAYLLRAPREKKRSWEDLQLALRTFAALG
ncbi:MAG: uracil-DNA glycosylase [Gammaproteobacteria bacterium]